MAGADERPSLSCGLVLDAALTEAHGDEHAVDLVAGFCITVRRLLAEHQAHEVKTIGD